MSTAGKTNTLLMSSHSITNDINTVNIPLDVRMTFLIPKNITHLRISKYM